MLRAAALAATITLLVAALQGCSSDYECGHDASDRDVEIDGCVAHFNEGEYDVEMCHDFGQRECPASSAAETLEALTQDLQFEDDQILRVACGPSPESTTNACCYVVAANHDFHCEGAD